MEQKASKIKFIYINTITVLITQILNIILGFVVRKTFVVKLGIIYLGYNSVFTNILSMLSLTELGIGVAIVSFLYKHIADNDTEHITALMYIFKQVYKVMGFIIALIGIIISFYLQVFIKDAVHDLSYLRTLFYINLAGSVSSYYMGYQRTLLIADQKTYIISMIDTILYLISSIVQVIILFIMPNYLVFLCVNIGKNVLSNIIVYLNCTKNYRFLKNKVNYEIVDQYKDKIKKYVREMFISKLGSYIFYSTDNLIISAFKGSLLAGFLSNYTMVINIVQNIINQILNSVQATFGIFIHSEPDIEKQKSMVNNYLFANYYLGNFCMICIIFLIQPFLQLYFGENYLLDNSTVILLGINLLFTILIQLPAQLFIIYRLFRYDQYIILASASLNIFISIFLVKRIGIDGVLIGTMITSLIYLYSRLEIVGRKIYFSSSKSYFIKLLYYYFVSAITALIAFFTTSWIDEITIKTFIIKIIIVGLIASLIPAILCIKTKELKYLYEKLLRDRVIKVIKRIGLSYVSKKN